jgi:hypothetical protein
MVQAAYASDGGDDGENKMDMRFHFGANVYKLDQPRVPGSRYAGPTTYTPPANVHAGSVPKLTLDPTFIKPAAPPPVVAPVVTATLIPQRNFAQLPKAFQSVFGKPLPPQTPLVAHNAAPLKPASLPAAKHAARVMPMANKRPVVAHNTSSPHVPSVASYGSGQGYIPGAQSMPTNSGSGFSANTNVSGTIIKRH